MITHIVIWSLLIMAIAIELIEEESDDCSMYTFITDKANMLTTIG